MSLARPSRIPRLKALPALVAAIAVVMLTAPAVAEAHVATATATCGSVTITWSSFTPAGPGAWGNGGLNTPSWTVTFTPAGGGAPITIANQPPVSFAGSGTTLTVPLPLMDGSVTVLTSWTSSQTTNGVSGSFATASPLVVNNCPSNTTTTTTRTVTSTTTTATTTTAIPTTTTVTTPTTTTVTTPTTTTVTTPTTTTVTTPTTTTTTATVTTPTTTTVTTPTTTTTTTTVTTPTTTTVTTPTTTTITTPTTTTVTASPAALTTNVTTVAPTTTSAVSTATATSSVLATSTTVAPACVEHPSTTRFTHTKRGFVVATVRGTSIKRVRYYVDGHLEKTLTKPNLSGHRYRFVLDPGAMRYGTHRLVVRYTGTCKSHVASTRFTHDKPASAIRPSFTG